MLSLLVGSQIVLKFHPSTGKPYIFEIVSEYQVGAPNAAKPFTYDTHQEHATKDHLEFRETMRFESRPHQRFALHGKVSRARSDRSDLVTQLNRSIFEGSYDYQGRTKKDSAFVHSQNGPYIDIDETLKLGIYSFMNFTYPPTAIKEGSTWTSVITGNQFMPSGEMIWTLDGQEVKVQYRVKKVSLLSGRTLVTVSEAVNTQIKQNSPGESHMVTMSRVRAEFTLDATDGILVEGQFERARQYHNTLITEVYSLH